MGGGKRISAVGVASRAAPVRRRAARLTQWATPCGRDLRAQMVLAGEVGVREPLLDVPTEGRLCAPPGALCAEPSAPKTTTTRHCLPMGSLRLHDGLARLRAWGARRASRRWLAPTSVAGGGGRGRRRAS